MYATLDNPLFVSHARTGRSTDRSDLGAWRGGGLLGSSDWCGDRWRLRARWAPSSARVLDSAATAISALIKNSGCGVTCVETSSWANQAEPLLRQNILAYFAQPAPEVAIFASRWRWQTSTRYGRLSKLTAANRERVTRECGVSLTGRPGHVPGTRPQRLRCWAFPGEPQSGACWNWFSGYRDPIANDSQVGPDQSSALAQGAADTSSSVIGSSLGSFGLPLLIAAGVLVGWVVLK